MWGSWSRKKSQEADFTCYRGKEIKIESSKKTNTSDKAVCPERENGLAKYTRSGKKQKQRKMGVGIKRL